MALNIKELRAKVGLNQTDFAKKIGKSKNTIINWEAGETSPTQKDIDFIVQIFGLDKPSKLSEPEMTYAEKSPLVEALRDLAECRKAYISLQAQVMALKEENAILKNFVRSGEKPVELKS